MNNMTTHTHDDHLSSPGSRRSRDPLPRRLAAVVACLAVVMTLVGTTPAAAAGNGNACFSKPMSYGIVRPLSGVRVQMHYYDFGAGSWRYSGAGFDRYTNANGCAYYELPSLGNHVQGLWWGAEGYYDWSTQYVMFAVWDVSSSGAAQRTFFGTTDGYVAPGTYGWQLNGRARCAGITCP